MKFSVTLFQTEPIQRMLQLIKRAEDEGFERVWIGDSHMIWREALVTIAAAFERTSRVEIGVAVTNPVTRHISVTASAFATLAELSQGRVLLGMGLGDSALETIGKKPARIAELEQSVQNLRTLLAGEDVSIGEMQARIAWASEVPRVPIFIGGSGPKMLTLGGRQGDGAIIMAGAQLDLLTAGVDIVTQSSETRPYTVAWIPASVLPVADEARDNVRGHVARCATHALAWDFPAEDQQLIEDLRHAYDYHGHLFPKSPQANLVPDRLVEMFAVAGSAVDVLERLRPLEEAPVDEIALVLHGHDRDLQMGLLSQEVLSRVS